MSTAFVKNHLTLFAGFPIAKGLTMAGTVVAVTHSGLSPFIQSLIIAVISASIGALGLICAAMVAARTTEQIGRKVDEVKDKLDTQKESEQ